MRNKWTLLLLLCVTFAVYTVDRALLGPLAIPIQAGTGVMFWHFAAALVAILLTGVMTDKPIVRWPRFGLALQAGSLIAAVPVLVMFVFPKSLMLVWFAAAAFGVGRDWRLEKLEISETMKPEFDLLHDDMMRFAKE